MKLIKIVVFMSLFGFLANCSGGDSNEVEDIEVEVETDDTTDPSDDIDTNEETDMPDDTDDNGDTTDVDEGESLTERYVFDKNLVIEHSYNLGGCDSPPCDTDSEGIEHAFANNNVPNDPYFYLSSDEAELNLLCQLDKGRRAEFKQISRGPLTSFASLELTGVYYDIPSKGVTIAQVHNRGGNSNKPFFRLVLHPDGLETVIRKDPEVSSSQTSFSKKDFSFLNNADYDKFVLTTTVEKSNGLVHINVLQDGVSVLDESYGADSTTKWVTDTGIANGFYLKGGLYNDDGPHTEDLIVGYTSVLFSSDDD